MGQYTIKDVQNRAEVLKNDVDNIYRALNDKLGSSPETLDKVPEYILSIPDLPTEEPLTITPTIDGQEISALDDLKYNPITVEPVTSAIDSNIQPENIKEGVTILGVAGTLKSGGGSDVFVVPDGMKFAYSSIAEISSNFDFSNVTDMNRMFFECSNLITIPQLDTSSVTTAEQMFYSCSNLTTIPQLDTSSVTTAEQMFYSCSKLVAIPQLNTSNATNMNNMFYNCISLTAIPQLDTSNVTNIGSMFYGCSNLTAIPQLDTSKVTNMGSIFAGCSALTTVEGIDFSGLTSDLNRLFGYTSSMSKLTRFIVNGKINVSISDNYSIKALTAIDYDSVKSILTAASNTDNTNAKELAFNRTMTDQNGELAALVASCSTKGWTISGLTLQ